MSRHSAILKTLLAGSALSALTIGQGLAQTDANAANDVIEVWGTRVQSTSLYVGEEDIELKQADHLSDLLRDIPGVDIGGTHSVNQRINFRGLDDRNINVFIDGALQTNYLFHHMGNLLINADILKSAEIELGSNSVVNDGLGGAIFFETKDARDLLEYTERTFGGRIMAGYNTNAQHSYSLTGYAQLSDRFDVMGYFNEVDRDNFEDGDGVETVGSDGTTQNMIIKLGFDISSNQRLELSYDRLEDEGLYSQRPDMGVRTNEAISPGILYPTEYTRETWNLGYELDLGDLLGLRVTAYTNDLSLYRDQRPGVSTERSSQSDNYGFNVLADSQMNWAGANHSLTYGGRFFHQELTNRTDLSTDVSVREEADSTSIFIEDEIDFGDGLMIRPGVRYNRYETQNPQTGIDESWDDVIFGLAGEYEVTDGFRLLASYTELFKGPELAEAYTNDAANKVSNPDLEPEGGENVEVGFRYSTTIGRGSLNIGANAFWMTVDDYISEVSLPNRQFQMANIGELDVEGYEASVHYGIGPWDLLATYAHAETDKSGLIGSNDGSLRDTGDQLGLGATYTFDNLDIVLDYGIQVIMDQDVPGGDDKPGYMVQNLSARWNEPFDLGGFSVLFAVDNLLDETYTSHASRTGETVHPRFGPLVLDDVEPGRNIKISLSQRF